MNHAQSPLIDGPHSAWLDAEGQRLLAFA